METLFSLQRYVLISFCAGEFQNIYNTFLSDFLPRHRPSNWFPIHPLQFSSTSIHSFLRPLSPLSAAFCLYVLVNTAINNSFSTLSEGIENWLLLHQPSIANSSSAHGMTSCALHDAGFVWLDFVQVLCNHSQLLRGHVFDSWWLTFHSWLCALHSCSLF